MLRFTKLICQDAFGTDYLEFDFVSGIHNVGGLNGAGKTTVYLALAQGLFNKNPKGTKIDDVSNIVTGKPYCITILFEKGSDYYKVVNSRKTGTIIVERNGKSLTKKTIPQNLELIKEILGDTYDTFVSMTYQSTESTLDLVEESSDTARKGFINRILKFDELDSLLAESKDKLKQVKLTHKAKVAQLESVQSSVLPLREVGELLDISSLEKELQTLAAEKDVSAQYVEWRRIEEQQTCRKLEEYNKYLVDKEEADRIAEAMASIALPEKSIEELQDEIAEYTKQATQVGLQLRQATDKLQSMKAPELNCSRCGHALSSKDALALYQKETEALAKAIEEFKLIKKEWEGKKWYAEEEALVWKQYNTYSDKLSRITLPSTIAKVDEDSYNKVKAKLAEAVSTHKNIEEAYLDKLTELTEAKGKNDLVNMIVKFNQEAEANNAEVALKAQALSEEVGDLEKRVGLLESWTRILGSSGYRVHRMSKFLQVLNQIMSKYSTIISDGKIRCSFFLTNEGKIDFNVVDADKTIPYSGWSGGEKSRVKLACLFSVLEILEVMGSASYNVLFLDEVFATLDESGREGLFEVLAHLKSTGKCVYTVSHTPIANAVVFDSTIKVEKINGITRIS